MIFEQSGFAQVAGQLDIALHLSAFRNSLAQDKFRPLHPRYFSYDNIKNNFKLLLDKGDFSLSSLRAEPLGEAKQSKNGIASGPFDSLRSPRNDTQRIISASLEKELRGIEQTQNGGIIPSNERIKEYLLSVCASGNFGLEFDKVLSCIADILRLEEERCNFTSPALREILMLLESDKSAQEVQLALATVNVDEKEPETVIE